ncbi:hypothetical protein LPC08_18210 [Roseomonas sp. OT10]|uniref:hypothetical protein n=1 Tax=Roseomonas cutis TaxID=2897332 RepID=UPI001E587A12|nr:hypothetical protein [Roseomonas sp. OT10]UFN47931.1 hypothetical protein LPC08_18210 [Roseomonas sp. OT10]
MAGIVAIQTETRAFRELAAAAREGAGALQSAQDRQEAIRQGLNPETGAAAIAERRNAQRLSETEIAERGAVTERAAQAAYDRAIARNPSNTAAAEAAQARARRAAEEELARQDQRRIDAQRGAVAALPPGTFLAGASPATIRANNATAARMREEVFAASLSDEETTRRLREISLNRAAAQNGMSPNAVGGRTPEWASGLSAARAGAPVHSGAIHDNAAPSASLPDGVLASRRALQTDIAAITQRQDSATTARRAQLEEEARTLRATARQGGGVADLAAFQDAFRAARSSAVATPDSKEFRERLSEELRLIRERNDAAGALDFSRQTAQLREETQTLEAQRDLYGASNQERERAVRLAEARNELARIGLGIDSEEYRQRVAALDAVTAAQDRADRAAGPLSRFVSQDGMQSWERWERTVTGALESAEDGFLGVAIAGDKLGESLEGIARAVAMDLGRDLLRSQVTGPIASWISSLGRGASKDSGASMVGSLIGAFSGLFGFANGGIMTPKGPVPLRQYASGGIARSPQLALFGEGRMPEAFVPLPDGNRIPVALSAPPVAPSAIVSAPNLTNNFNVTVNAGGGGGNQGLGGGSPTNAADSQRIGAEVVRALEAKMNQIIADQMRTGGQLNPISVG